MNCEEVQQNLSAYMDDELSVEERREVDLHLASCSECRRSLYELRDLSLHVTANLMTVVAPFDTESRVMTVIRARREDMQVQRLTRLYIVGAIICAIVSIVVVTSPIGLFARAFFRLSFAAVNGLVNLSGVVGHMWVVWAMLLSFIVAGLSLTGVVRLLRSTNREATL